MAADAHETATSAPRRAIVVFTLFAAGLIAGRSVTGVEPAWWFVASAVAAALGAATHRWRCKALFSIAVIAIGAGWFGVRVRTAPVDDFSRFVSTQDASIVHVQGVAMDRPIIEAGGRGRFAASLNMPPHTKFTLRVTALISMQGVRRSASGTLRVRVNEVMTGVEAGDRLGLWGMARPVTGPTNPGEHDARLWATQIGLSGYLSVPSRELVAPITIDETILERAHRRLLRWRGVLRTRAVATLERSLGVSSHGEPGDAGNASSQQGKAVIEAMLLGARTPPLRDAQAAFYRTGIGYMLAISGLHLGVLTWTALMLLRATGDRGRLELVLVAAIIALYLLVVPVRTPIVRAAIMAFSYLGAEAVGRRYDKINTLAWTAVIVLLWRPMDLWAPGFQLSFGVVAALLTFSRSIARRWFGEAPASDAMTLRLQIWWWLKYSVETAVCAWAIALPIVAFHFGYVSWIAPLTSLLIGPLLMLALGAGYAALLASIALPSAAVIAGPILTWTGAIMTTGAMTLDQAPWATIFLPKLSLGWTLSTAAVVTWWLWRGSWRHVVSVAATLVVITWLAVTAIGAGAGNDIALRIDTIDVGDGACHLLRSGRDAMLWDVGSSDLAMGERRLPRILRTLGVRSVRTIVITHPNLDHYAAALDIVRPLGVREVLVSQAFFEAASDDPDGPVAMTLDGFADAGVKVRVVAEGDRLRLGRVTFEFLSPPRDTRWQRVNDASLVALGAVETDAGERSALFCGDIEAGAIEALLRDHPELEPDVLEAPHHGSATRAAFEFVRTLDPAIVLQSTGPSRAHDERWASIRSSRRWWSTAESGAIRVVIRRDGAIDDHGFLKAPR